MQVRITLFFLFFLSYFTFAQHSTIKGRILDQFTGEAVKDAEIHIQGSARKAFTNDKGYFLVKEIYPGFYPVEISAKGYEDIDIYEIHFAADTVQTLNLIMRPTSVSQNTMTVTSASGHREKPLHASASTGVVDRSLVSGEIYPGISSILKNSGSVNTSYSGIDQPLVTLGGYNSVSGGNLYLLSDQRQATIPGLGLNLFSSLTPVVPDIDRIEVVSSPESPVFGIGANAGVVHYVTKDPFTQPGLFISGARGEREAQQGVIRLSNAFFNRVGIKLAAEYAEAIDWELDSLNRRDQKQFALDADGLTRNYDFRKLNMDGALKIKFHDKISLTANGGYSLLSANILTDLGTTQLDSFVHVYGQARLRAGGFFAQGYMNQNREGNFINYATGDTLLDKSQQTFGQAQYHFKSAYDKIQILVGGDMDKTLLDTEKTRYGRNEENLEINKLGFYTNAKMKLSQKFAFNAAIRADREDVFDKIHISPRFGALYHPHELHTVRFAYNRGVSLPGNNQLFLDLTMDEQPYQRNGVHKIVFRGMGAKNGFTFNGFRNTGQVTSFAILSDSTFNSFGQAYSINSYPVGNVYLFTAENLTEAFNRSEAEIPAVFKFLTPDQRTAFLDLITLMGKRNIANNVTTTAVLGIPSPNGGYQPIDAIEDVAPLKESFTQRFEAGYKGIIDNRLLLSADIYYQNIQNFVGPMRLESPYVYIPTEYIRSQVIDFLTSGDPEIVALLDQISPDPSVITGTITSFVSQTPTALVQPDASANANTLLPASAPNEVGALLTYRNYGRVNYMGLNLGAQFQARHDLVFFSHFSFISDNFFDNEELAESNTDLSLALNTPKMQFKTGMLYNAANGLMFGLSFRYSQAFPVQSGPYIGGLPEPYGNSIGGVETLFLTDANIGFNFRKLIPGLRLDVSVKNMLDLEYREFTGAPAIGRFVLGRMALSF